MLKNVLAGLVVICALAFPAAAFDREAWQAVLVTEKGPAIELKITKPPGGVYFRKMIDPTRRYQLTIKGAGPPINLRMKLDDRPYDYMAAPKDTLSLTIVKARQVELLFYSESAATYTVSSLEIAECSGCRTAEDLRARILADVPEIGATSGLTKAKLLLKWASNFADYTTDPTLIPADFESWPIERAAEFFDSDQGGVLCGGFSVFLRRVFHMFDVDALTINYGIPQSLVTHVTVIVRDGQNFYLFDPMFGATFSRGGRDIPIDEVLKSVRSGNFSDIELVEYGLTTRDVIGPASLEKDLLCDTFRQRADGAIICKIGPRNMLKVYATVRLAPWETAGIRLDHVALVRPIDRGVFGVGPALASDTRDKFLALLSELRVPMHAPQ